MSSTGATDGAFMQFIFSTKNKTPGKIFTKIPLYCHVKTVRRSLEETVKEKESSRFQQLHHHL